MTNDRKICDVALTYIRKAARREEWPHTVLGKLHPSLVDRLPFGEGELVVVSAYFSPESWYAFTTRRIVSQFRGVRQSIDPSHGIDDDFGNFKGYAGWPDSDAMQSAGRRPGVVPREVATIKARRDSAAVQFEFETWEASMLPIYAARYWHVKHPAIDKLMTHAQLEEYRTRTGLTRRPTERREAAPGTGTTPQA